MKYTLIVLTSLILVLNSCSKSASESTPDTEPIKTLFPDGYYYAGTFYYVPTSVSYSNGVFYFSGTNTTPGNGVEPACNGNYEIVLKVRAKDTGTYKLYTANYLTITASGFCSPTTTYTTDTSNSATLTIIKFDTIKKVATGGFSGLRCTGSFTNLTW